MIWWLAHPMRRRIFDYAAIAAIEQAAAAVSLARHKIISHLVTL
jgi:hypothetical protein